MTNLVKLVQEEIRRLARREAKPELDRMKKEFLELRRTISQLKKRLGAVERYSRNGSGPRLEPPQEVLDVKAPPAASRARITSNTIKTLRQRLGLTQAEFGKLVGVSGQSVYQWERRDGRLQLRRATRQAILQAKSLGVREARARLQELE